MSISIANLTSGADTTGSTSYATASVSPTAGRLPLCAVVNSLSTGATLPTVTGAGLTWTQIQTETFNTIASQRSRVTLFRGDGAPSSGALTIDFGATAQQGCCWIVDEVTVSAGKVPVIVQSAINNVDASTSLTVTLGAFSDSGNGTYGCFGNNVGTAGSAFTEGGGFAELADTGHATPVSNIMSEWRSDNDTSVDCTFASGEAGGIALEIAEVSAVPAGRRRRPIRRRGRVEDEEEPRRRLTAAFPSAALIVARGAQPSRGRRIAIDESVAYENERRRPPQETGPRRTKYYHDGRGLYRVFNAAEYRFYRSSSGFPEETDPPYATSAALPATPADVFADGAWYIAMSYFNGVIDSGFLAIGPNGEPALRIDISAGVEINSPPNAPNDVRLVQRAGGVVRALAAYFQFGALRAEQWAITYTVDGSDPGEPPAVSPTDFVVMPSGTVVCVLEYDLPAQVHGTTCKVRVQTRRQDAVTWRYSEGSTILSTTADVNGPSAPVGMTNWRGRVQ